MGIAHTLLIAPLTRVASIIIGILKNFNIKGANAPLKKGGQGNEKKESN